jgi:hypothetical protein
MAISENAWPQSAVLFLTAKRKEEDMEDAKAILTNFYFYSLRSLRSLRLRISFIAFLGGHVFREKC